MPLQIHENSAVVVAAPKGEIVHTKHARGDKAGRRGFLESVKQGTRADSHTERGSNPCGGFAANEQCQFPQSIRQSRGFPSIPRRDRWYWLCENAADAGAIVAEESARRDFYLNSVALPGQIEQSSTVTAMHSVTETATERTANPGACRSHREKNRTVANRETVQCQALRVGEQVMSGLAAVLPHVKSNLAGKLHQIFGTAAFEQWR
jgi:hypothetical protein